MMGDEWRIGINDGPFEYRTNPDHEYQAGEVIICAMQCACSEEDIGFRYENPPLIKANACEAMSKFPIRIEEIGGRVQLVGAWARSMKEVAHVRVV